MTDPCPILQVKASSRPGSARATGSESLRRGGATSAQQYSRPVPPSPLPYFSVRRRVQVTVSVSARDTAVALSHCSVFSGPHHPPPLGGSSGWRFGLRQRVDWPAACLQVYGCWLAGPEPRSSRPVCNAGQPWLGLSPFPPSLLISLSESPPLLLALPPSLPPSLGVCCMLPRELTRACGCLSLCWLSLLVTSLTRPPAGQPRLGFGELLPDLFLIADRKLF